MRFFVLGRGAGEVVGVLWIILRKIKENWQNVSAISDKSRNFTMC